MIALRLQNPSDVAQKVGWPQVRGMVGWGRQVTSLRRHLQASAPRMLPPALQAPSALLVVARHSALLACGQEAPAGQAWCLAEASGELFGRLRSRTAGLRCTCRAQIGIWEAAEIVQPARGSLPEQPPSAGQLGGCAFSQLLGKPP